MSGARIAMLLCMISICGCMTQGKKLDSSTAMQFINGKSTISDVTNILGQPQTRSSNGMGETTINYSYTRTTPDATTFIPVANLFSSGVNMDMETHSFTFNRKGILEKQDHSETHQ